MQFRQGEIAGVEIRTLQQSTDERGWLVEIFRSDEVEVEVIPAMCYASMTRPGVGRGPHEHIQQTDVFCFIGPGTFEVHLWDNRPESPTYKNYQTVITGEGTPMVIVVPPGVVHGYKNVGEVDAMMINLPNRLYKGKGRHETVDEIRHEKDPKSLFRLE